MKGTLYVVATPIGNAGDITDRAKLILREADIVAAEDTRSTKKLFGILGINNRAVSNHKFNERRQVDYLLARLEGGKNIALVSDAGTPCVSDPGGIIVNAAAERGINVVSVCGASAVTAALSVCGFHLESFAFYGFLPKETNGIRKTIESARKSAAVASVFFESPKRVKRSLKVFDEETPEAELCLCNDLTKMFERVYRGYPRKILGELDDNPSSEKGEYTLVANLGRAPEASIGAGQSNEALLADYIAKNRCSLKEAVSALADANKGVVSKKELYNAALSLKAAISGDRLWES
ncbi:MAG: 16S rRNA (cytidine(1402)-2'-O)-methyltransferase [Oscillospiraceae bacterium]|nr:16S rRNA (cytidine(1402)-2'-O)-methyltransferase [Oscillospiraceae bacterium]